MRNGLRDNLFNMLDRDWFRLYPFDVFNWNVFNSSDRVRSLRNPFSPFNIVWFRLEPFDMRNLIRLRLNPFLPRMRNWFGLNPLAPFDLV